MKFISSNYVRSIRWCLNAVNYVKHQRASLPKEGCVCGTMSRSHPQARLPLYMRSCSPCLALGTRALPPEGPGDTGPRGAGKRLRVLRLRRRTGPAAPPQPKAGALRAALAPLPPPPPPPPRRGPPGGAAPPLPRAGSAAGGASSGPLCAPASRRDVSAGRAGPGRVGWRGEARQRNRLRRFRSESGTSARSPAHRCSLRAPAPVSGLRGAPGGSEGAAAARRAFSHPLSVVSPQAGPGDRPP